MKNFYVYILCSERNGTGGGSLNLSRGIIPNGMTYMILFVDKNWIPSAGMTTLFIRVNILIP
jgi:hypothetical protein